MASFEMEPPDEPCPDCGSTHHQACPSSPSSVEGAPIGTECRCVQLKAECDKLVDRAFKAESALMELRDEHFKLRKIASFVPLLAEAGVTKPDEWICPGCTYKHNSIYSLRCLKCERWKDGFEDRAEAGVEVEREEEAWITELATWYTNRAMHSKPDDPETTITVDAAWLHGLFQEIGLEVWQASRASRREPK